MGKLFGTDGIHGVAGEELTARLRVQARAFARRDAACRQNNKPKVIIGKDTRLSGDMFETGAVGLCAGGSTHFGGIVPTPAVAYLTVRLGADNRRDGSSVAQSERI